MRETEQIVAVADSALENRQYPAATRLLQTWGSAERPPRDSVLLWVRAINGYYSARPILGTAEALVATGDLTLLRDDSLRAEITVYLDATRDHQEAIAGHYELSQQALAEIGEHFDYLDATLLAPESVRRERGQLIARLAPTADWASPFPLDVETFYANQEMYNWVHFVALVHMNTGMRRQHMRDEAAALRQLVETQIDP